MRDSSIFVVATAAAMIAFVWSLVTYEPPAPRESRYGAGTRSFYRLPLRETFGAGDMVETARLAREALERDLTDRSELESWYWLAMARQRMGEADAADAWECVRALARPLVAEGVPTDSGINPEWYLGWALRGLGDEAGAQAAFVLLVERYERDGLPGRDGLFDYNSACFRALAGDLEGALAALERAAGHPRGIDVAWAAVDPDLDALRDDPRYQRAIERAQTRGQGFYRLDP